MPLLQPPAPGLRPSELTYVDGYNSIVSRVRRKPDSRSGGVIVFANVDVDGLLASRILASLFRQDDVPYRLVPIGGYTELAAKRDEALASEELHTIILLSLGSLLDLADYFRLPAGCHLHIIDAHRPWNLDNLFRIDVEEDEGPEGEGRIWVWGDGAEGSLDVKKSWEALEYEPSDSEDGSDSEYDEDNDDEDDQEEDAKEGDTANGRKRRREGSSKANKRRREGDEDKPRRLAKHVREAHMDRINRYYRSGTSFGMSVAWTVYLLATVLERADNDLLWLAILAVTNQYVAAHMDRESYTVQEDMLGDEVVRLNPVDGNTGPDPDNRSITRSEELRFVLFRHWNLYDAMLHSGYVASRLGIWKEKGRRRLQQLLAKMGLSLQQCQQEYVHMDMTLKRDLPNNLGKFEQEYGLMDLVYPSFTRAFGFQLAALSAADAVDGLGALLDAATGINMEVEVEGGRGGGEWFGGTRTWAIGNETCLLAEEKAMEGESEDQKEHKWHVQNFWIAYDACDDIALLRKSLQLSKSLHRAVMRQGSAILDKGTIRKLRSFRFAAVREGPDLRLFCNPAPLSRLALWLVDSTRDRWAEKENNRKAGLPFVIAVLNEVKKTFSVVGVTAALDYGDVRKNKFGLAFQNAVEELNLDNARQDMFDTSFIEVPEGDLQDFVEALQMGSAYN